MTLFPTSSMKPKSRPPAGDKRPRARIATGAPRLVESSSDRAARSEIETFAGLLAAVRRSTSARLLLLEGRQNRDRIACPWERITGCGITCRCGGAGTVTVEFLRRHYEQLAPAIVALVQPSFARRSS